ncbi:FMN-binding domain-containing protein [Anaerovirgula multivorans]|uniref:FMN-binding domain-containing protein n=1 Tax=Anaerovirgula multivorans TaxID=312168 RepID=A0A239I3D5_9FIRM|nr:FMN-binding protein [Anaerovirgula multivorans]SNS88029.1 FMN-binding domain-containing protein [Anaerovirgula multivorans]
MKVVEGYGGDMMVEVKFSSMKMLSVAVSKHNETEGLGDKAINHLSKAIVEAQTYDVDTSNGGHRYLVSPYKMG